MAAVRAEDLSLPKTIGIGPTITRPPTFFSVRPSPSVGRARDRAITMAPMKISDIPSVNKARSR